MTPAINPFQGVFVIAGVINTSDTSEKLLLVTLTPAR
jgi:hypothetical protein